MSPRERTKSGRLRAALLAACLLASPLTAQVAVRAELLHTMAGEPLQDAVVLCEGGKITAVGPAADVRVPDGWRTLRAAVVTPGLVDAHTVVGLAGWLNGAHDQDQLERSTALQPELRALDAYNAREPLIEWVRGFGVTTIHTGHAPGAVVSGQTMIAKTAGESVDQAVLKPVAMVAATLGESALRADKEVPGTRAKSAALLRAELVAAREYVAGLAKEDVDQRPARSLRLEALGRVLSGELPLLVTAQRAQDISTALRIAAEFEFELVLDGAAEAYLLLDPIRAAGVSVIVHPTMYRSYDETENLSMETAAALKAAGIPFALQSGYESYVPKTRVILFEAGVAAANGLSRHDALASITIDAARLLGIDERVGSLEVGKDADLALYDGDPLEYTSHCLGVVIDGAVVSEVTR